MKRVWTIVLGAALLLQGGAAGAVDIEQVAIRGDSPAAGLEYVRFRRPAIGDAATTPVSFTARAKGTAGSGWGIFLDAAGEAGSTIQFKDDLAPDSRTFRTFDNPTTNDDGNVAFTAKLSGGSEGVFRENDTLVALRGDDLSAAVPPVTGLLGRVSGSRGPGAQVTDDGDVIFHATILDAAEVNGVDIDEGVFRCTGGDGDCSSGSAMLETLVLRNDAVPDRPGREICAVTQLGASTFGVVILADTQLDCTDGGEVPLRGVFRMAFGGAIVTLALQGEDAEPDTIAPTTTYGVFTTPPDVANDGSVVFKARTAGEVFKEVLYLCAESICPATPAEAAVIQGDVGPDTNEYRSFGTPVVADGGLMAFKAKGRGSNGSITAIYRRQPGGVIDTLIARGDTLPGFMAPTENEAEVKRLFERLDLSPGGQLAFHAKVREPGDRSREGIFVADLTL